MKPRNPTRVTSLRLPEDLAADAAMVARIDGVPLSAMMGAALEAHIRQRRADPEFQKRLRERIAKDERLLLKMAGTPT